MAPRDDLSPDVGGGSKPLLDALCGRFYQLGLRARIDLCLSLVEAVASVHREGRCFRSLDGSEFLVDTEFRQISLADSCELCAPGDPVGPWLVWLLPQEAAEKDEEGEKDVEPVASVERDLYAMGVFVQVLLFGQEPAGDWSSESVVALLESSLVLGELPSDFRTFLSGLSDPETPAPSEDDWTRALAWLRAAVYHTVCRHELLIGDAGLPARCPLCGAELTGVPRLAIDDAPPLPASDGLRIYGCMLWDAPSKESMRLVAEVVASRHDRLRLGLRNVSGMELSAVKRSGEGRLLSSGSVMPLLPGATLHPYGSTVRVVAQEGDAHE